MFDVLLISTTDYYITWFGTLIWIGFLIMFAYCFVDIFRRADLSGAAKALWAFFIFVIPFIGVFAYLIFRPSETSLNEDADYQRTHFRASGPSVASTAAADIAHAQALLDAGTITEAEFQDRKYRAEAGFPATGPTPDFLSDKESK